jgi:serine/threonine protein kinase
MAPTSLTDIEQGTELGRGAIASVRLATAAADGKRYALKVVEKAKIVGQSQLTRLYREKELLSALSHPSVVGFHGTFKDEAHLYFLLELLSGGELLWHMRRERRCRIAPHAARVCLGALLLPLRYMQEQNVLYRDLKPTNVMFSATGRLKLVDLGHAKRFASPAALSDERSTSVVGTPHYHAPETVRGEGHGLAAQLWALGVMLVEMLAGRPPFWEGGGFPPLREQILEAQPDLIPLPDEAKPLAQSLLQADPVARAAAFATAEGGVGYAGVMAHEYLASLDWAALEAGTIVPAFDFAAHAAELLGEDVDKSAGADDVQQLSKVFEDF